MIDLKNNIIKIKKPILFLTSLVLLLASCNKEKCPDRITSTCNYYTMEKRTTTNFDYEKEPINYGIFVGPFYKYSELYSYHNLAPNPNNEFEFCYVRYTNIDGYTEKREVFTYDICTNQSLLVADNFYYGFLDWSKHNWILYTGTDGKVNRVKSNGDSLSAISTLGGTNIAGRWSPSGDLYFNKNSAGLSIEDKNGTVVKMFQPNPIQPYDWFNDSIILGIKGSKLSSFNIYTEELITLHQEEINFPFGALFDKNNICYYVSRSSHTQSPQNNYNLVFKYHLDGSNQIDTVCPLYNTYVWDGGFMTNNGKIITNLRRSAYDDTTSADIMIRHDIILIDADGSNARMFKFSE